MSIISELYHNLFQKKIGFNSAVTTAAGEFDKWLAANPALSQDVSATLSQFKTLASQAESVANTEMGAHYADAVTLVQQGLDAFVLGATKGAALPAVPIVNAGVSAGFGFFRGLIDQAEAAFNASLSIPTPAVPTIPVAPAATPNPAP